jgi:hypothetical protein
MSLKPNSDSATAPEFSQAQIDAKFPASASTSLWKLASSGVLQLCAPLVTGGTSVRITGPQLAADGTVLQASQTFNMSAADLAQLNLAAGLVIAGP